ncbi:MAG TPA: hypothetical protein VIC33_03945 [Vicinamibacterales bacterium]
MLQIQRGLLLQYGWLRSWLSGRPVDAAGDPLPWLAYPAIDFLSQFDFSDASIFEWGSGFSTLWWSTRCKRITSVESNPAWIPYIQKHLPGDVELIVTPCDADSEVAALTNQPVEHDVFVIDNHGPFRWRCAEAATRHLAAGGFIILDNSDQCPKACHTLRESGLVQVDFTGFAPGSGYAQATSIFFRDRYRFRPRSPRWPPASPAQPNGPWEGC